MKGPLAEDNLRLRHSHMVLDLLDRIGTVEVATLKLPVMTHSLVEL